MKHLFLLLSIFTCFSFYGQELRPIPQKIEDYKQNNGEFTSFELFSKVENSTEIEKLSTLATDATVLELNNSQLQTLITEKPKAIEVSFYYQQEKITVQLLKTNNFTEDFKAFDEKGKEINYNLGAYYQGIVANEPNSLVGFSFFNNEVMGVTSSLSLRNVVLGKIKGSNHFISYADHNLTKENPFMCGVDTLKENNESEKITESSTTANTNMTNNCVRVYYEIAYAPYINNNSDTTATLNWLTAIHNNIATLYSNDDIQTALSEVMIWTSEDPYQFGYSGNLSYFANTRTGFNGDLAHLINYPTTTSVAYLNSLCSENRFAYSGIDQYYQDVPTYSWTIMAMTHEMGHALGSPHTHACAWNGDNTAIDGCGPQSGNGEGCDAVLPDDGGTIMSYCHLVPGVGISFLNGFGEQPATLIQNTIDSKSCLGTDCTTSECSASVYDATFTEVTQNSATVNIIDDYSTEWEYKIYPENSYSNNWISTTSQSFDLSQLEPNSYYVIEIKNICNNPGSLNISTKRMFLTDGDYCNGDLFTDTGGTSGFYGNQEYFVKTFYPGDGEALTMTFNEFALELDYDFMTVYNGESTEDPTFPNANMMSGNTNPGPFTSTHSSGAITVKFISDPAVNLAGWNVSFSCENLSTSNQELNLFSLYPNPTSSEVHISAKEMIKDIKVYDTSGRLIQSLNNIEAEAASLQLGAIANGVYFIQVTSKNGEETKQIIKK
ncbi:T9SS type A sorting domain-containing protein [Mesonia sp.]|uniref:T9SS type A sorting domain-containing protein n=1 Tax=Mesonia sp. TaxID=1960830 RepID=UPI003F984E49